jgi:hypothetical protein
MSKMAPAPGDRAGGRWHEVAVPAAFAVLAGGARDSDPKTAVPTA